MATPLGVQRVQQGQAAHEKQKEVVLDEVIGARHPARSFESWHRAKTAGKTDQSG